MADYLQELRQSIDDRKKRTAVLKPSAKAAREKQYGMTDGGGKTRTAVSTAVKPTTALTGQQSTAIVKPSVQAAREKQYGITDWKDTKPQTAVKPEAVPLVSARPEEKSEKQHWTKTVLDVAERGAGYGVEGLFTAADVVANAVPTVEGWVFGTDKDATFTGQVLKPITYLTGAAADWARDYNAATQARIENDTRDSRAARIVADVGSGVVGALPSVALAILSGGGTAAAQLGTQAAGISGTAVNAANAMLHNPVVQYNFATSLGNEYNAAKASGASDMDAMTAATVSGLFNAIVESGGVEALPKQLRGTDLSTAQKAWRWLISLLAEGEEEVVQGVISEMTAKATYAPDKPYFSITDENAVINPRRMGREFGYGTAVGGILGGVPMASAKAVELAARAANTDTKLNIDNIARSVYDNIKNGGVMSGRDQLHGTSGTGIWTGSDGGQVDQGLSGRSAPDGQGNLSVSGIVLLSPESQRTLTQRGIVNVELQECSADNAAFSAALDDARNADPVNGWAVTPKTSEELDEASARTFMDGAGSTGFAIATDGDIQAVFANKSAGAPKGATKSTIPQAIALGGKKLDCYGYNLVKLYAQYGFVPVARVEFVAEYANDGWTPDKGEPEIYFMMHNGDSADTVVQKMSSYKEWSQAELDALPLMGYDEAYAYRDELLAINEMYMRSADEGIYTEYIRQVREAQEKVRAEELRQAYLQNMARLEEVEREAEMDAVFWKGFDR